MPRRHRETFAPRPLGVPKLPASPAIPTVVLAAALTAGMGLNLALAIALVSIR